MVVDELKNQKRLLGEVLVDGDFISPRDLDRALDEQKESNERLGEILLRLGVLSEMELKAVLATQIDMTDADEVAGVRQRLGDILLKAKRVTSRQLDRALEEQKRTNERLGEVLVRFGLITATELDAVLNWQQDSAKSPAAVRMMLGEILVATDVISRSQLEKALNKQQLTKQQIGEILIDAGYVKPNQILEALRIQSKLVAASLVAALAMSALSGCGMSPPSVPTGAGYGTAQGERAYYYEQTYDQRQIQQQGGSSQVKRYDNVTVIDGVPFFKQNSGDNTCGQAAMSVVLNYWGKDVSYQQVVNENNRFNLATSQSTISSYLKSKGLKVNAYRKGNMGFLYSLIDQGRPPVVLLDYDGYEHYVVVVGYNKAAGTILIHDSIDGPYEQIPLPKFKQMWQNKSITGIPLVGGANYEGLLFDIQG